MPSAASVSTSFYGPLPPTQASAHPQTLLKLLADFRPCLTERKIKTNKPVCFGVLKETETRFKSVVFV